MCESYTDMSLRKMVQFDFELFLGKRGVYMCVRCGGEGGGGRKGVSMDLYASPEWRMSFIFLLLS